MFFKRNKDEKKIGNLEKIAALLIHAAKIDENYSNIEEKIIRQALLEFGANNENINEIIKVGHDIENNSNQILEFTKEVKIMSEKDKIKIIEKLWKIIFSNKEADMYETNLMRRLEGLLYIDSKIIGNIKEKIRKEYLA